MKCYLVGGAVRDRLLGYPVKEKDWVVIGETPESMVEQGFKPVGNDFPVFLHPVTHEEYALARTERKIASGYKGFAVHASKEVTLEDDLIRRDLTINAMALDENQNLIDPYGGQKDLEAKLIRHVSPAFSEDPVRILRVARFAARFKHLGFKVAPETFELMRDMTASGEVDALVAERVWAELIKALSERSPAVFFSVLRECGALKQLMPEIDRLFGVPQPENYHPEIDTGIHSMMVLEQAAKLTDDTRIRFAALTHDLGKGLTPQHLWPKHHGHEKTGITALEALCSRLKAPKEYLKLAKQVMLYHSHCHKAFELRVSTLVDLLQNLDSLRKDKPLDFFLLACEADARGRLGGEDKPYPQADYLKKIRELALSVTTQNLIEQGFKGEELGQQLRLSRIQAVKNGVGDDSIQ